MQRELADDNDHSILFESAFLNLQRPDFSKRISQYLKEYISSDTNSGKMVVGYIGDGTTGSLYSDWRQPFASFALGRGRLGSVKHPTSSFFKQLEVNRLL
ncbi:TPA: hypothetical protein SMF29_001617 [Serratia marcescens]|nr:hypothetical protein [Serratia marcescens]